MAALPDVPTLLLLSGIVFAAYCVHALSGFASNIVALTLGALVMDVASLVPIVVLLSTLFSAYVVLVDHATIDRKLLITRVLPLAGVGTIAGALVAPFIGSSGLQRTFGVLVVLLSTYGLWVRLRRSSVVVPRSGPITICLMLVAGVVHGLFATGGPPLILAVDRAGLAKSAFRSTLSVVWVVLGLVLLAVFLASGRIGLIELECVGALTPAFLLGLAVGNWGHHRIDERRFRIVTYVVLMVAGAVVAR